MRKLKSLCSLLLLSCVATAQPAMAKSEATAADSKCPRSPAFDVHEALKLATEQRAERPEPIEDFFVDLAALRCVDGRAFWEIGWRRRAYESGHLVMQIYMDRTIAESIVKDG